MCKYQIYKYFYFAAQVMNQFPSGFQGTSLPAFVGMAAANFGNFRPQFSVPGQQAVSASFSNTN